MWLTSIICALVYTFSNNLKVYCSWSCNHRLSEIYQTDRKCYLTKVSRVTNNNTVWVTKKGVTVPNRWGYFVSFEKHASVGYINAISHTLTCFSYLYIKIKFIKMKFWQTYHTTITQAVMKWCLPKNADDIFN